MTRRVVWLPNLRGVSLLSILLVSMFCFACQQPLLTKNYGCRNRQTYVNTTTGVDDPTIVLCPGGKMTWNDHGEDWEVDFKNDSPFEGKPMKVKKGDGPKVARSDTPVGKDTAFPYSITVNGKTFDPQIIVMN